MADITVIVKKLRDIRTRENLALKPSPYLRSTFVDEYGETREVKIRNYQAQGIMNLLQMERMILADSTGLGKTIQILSSIGYIWLKEPDYVPIIITTKSALYQWEHETKKFMQGMTACLVDDEPYKRHNLYEDFFLKHDPSKKRLLLLTYDTIMRDATQAVVKDRSHKPKKGEKKLLVEARKQKKIADETFQNVRSMFETRFGNRSFDVHEFIRKRLSEQEERLDPPADWTKSDELELSKFASSRSLSEHWASEVQKLSDAIAPPKVVPGLVDYINQLQHSHPHVKFMLVMDEMHKLKNHKSQFHTKVHDISKGCRRVVGMTATPVKNRLMEFFSLFRIIKPDLFPKISHFQGRFCVVKMQPIGGGRNVPVVVGYRNLDQFVGEIEPYYLSRQKHDVAKELPALISMEIDCELSEMQEELYDMAETGLLSEMDEDESSATLLASMTGIQQASNAPQLLRDEEDNPFEGPSCKIEALHEILSESALGKKVIIFSRFEKMITLIEKSLSNTEWEDDAGKKRRGMKCVRITGVESDSKVREKAKNLFQDPNSGINIVLITMAGSESINLQAAEHFVFIDLPWSWGDYVQLVGRMIRIGSQHTTVVAHHMLARKRNGDKTIDHMVLQTLRDKKKLADKVAGESLQGGLALVDNDVAMDVLSMIREAGVKRAGDKGTLLAEVNAKLASDRAIKKSPSKKLSGGKKPPYKAVEKHVPASIIDIDMSDL